MRAAIIIVVVVIVLIGGILGLRTSRRSGMPGRDVLERAKEREREQAAKDKSDEDS